jgi:hypothetical protein
MIRFHVRKFIQNDMTGAYIAFFLIAEKAEDGNKKRK